MLYPLYSRVLSSEFSVRVYLDVKACELRNVSIPIVSGDFFRSFFLSRQVNIDFAHFSNCGLSHSLNGRKSGICEVASICRSVCVGFIILIPLQSSQRSSGTFINFKVFAARVVLQGNIVFFFHNKTQRCFLQFRLSSSILFCWESLTSFSFAIWSSILSKPSRQETFQCHWWLRLSHHPNSLLFRGENNPCRCGVAPFCSPIYHTKIVLNRLFTSGDHL